MATGKNFEYLGNTFQLQLLNQIIVDKDFSHSIIDVIENNYFENKYFKNAALEANDPEADEKIENGEVRGSPRAT